MHEGICQNYQRCNEIVLSLTIRGIEFEDSVTKKKKSYQENPFEISSAVNSKFQIQTSNIEYSEKNIINIKIQL